MSDELSFHDAIEDAIHDNAGHLAIAGALAAQSQRNEQTNIAEAIRQQIAALAASGQNRSDQQASAASRGYSFSRQVATLVSVGATVPDFEMETYEPKVGDFGKVSLADIKKAGKWTVLVFYPADFTFVCPTELADLADQQEKLAALGAHVIAVSTDTKFAHMVWRNTEGLMKNVKYTLAADPTGTVSKLFGVYDCGSGLALRGTFIINPEGKLVSSEVNFYNVGRNASELVRKMEANVHLMANPSEACPANWKPGAKTLTPGKDLVGNVAAAME